MLHDISKDFPHLRGRLEQIFAEGASESGAQHTLVHTQGLQGSGQGKSEMRLEESMQRVGRKLQLLSEKWQQLRQELARFRAQFRGLERGPHGFMYGPFPTAQSVAKQLAALLQVSAHCGIILSLRIR